VSESFPALKGNFFKYTTRFRVDTGIFKSAKFGSLDYVMCGNRFTGSQIEFCHLAADLPPPTKTSIFSADPKSFEKADANRKLMFGYLKVQILRAFTNIWSHITSWA
jgi:hypothetical protein